MKRNEAVIGVYGNKQVANRTSFNCGYKKKKNIWIPKFPNITGLLNLLFDV